MNEIKAKFSPLIEVSSNWDKIENIEILVKRKTFIVQQIELQENNELIDKNDSDINELTQIMNYQEEYELLKETWYKIEEKKKKKKEEEEIKWLEIHIETEKEAIKTQKRFYQEQIFLIQKQIIQMQEIINNKDLYI